MSNMQNKLTKISYDYIVIDSEEFVGVAYAILKGEMTMITRNNGRLDLSLINVPILCEELMEIYETYKDNDNIMVNQLQKDQAHGKRSVKAREQKVG